MNGRERIGIISVPWMGVPPKGQGSIAGKTHRLTEALADRYAFTVVGGATGRAPDREHPSIDYVAVDERLDRRYVDRLISHGSRLVGRGRHNFYQPLYHPLYIRRAAEALGQAGCATVLVHEFPQWLSTVRRKLPDARLMVWGGADSFIEADNLLPRLEEADGLIGSSRWLATRFVERVPSLSDRTHVVYSGIDVDTFRPEPDLRPGNRLVYVGRVTPEKGVHLLVDAFRELAETRPELHLVLAGPNWVTDPALLGRSVPHHLDEVTELAGGDYQAELTRRAGPHADRLVMTGPLKRDGVVELLGTATVFCHAVLCEEGFGQSVAEALACGVPVVVSSLGAPPEFVTDGETGRIVPPGDHHALVDTLAQLLDDDQHRRALGTAAVELARTRLSVGAAAEDLALVLDCRAPTIGELTADDDA